MLTIIFNTPGSGAAPVGPPVISDFQPTSGKAGVLVVITGSGFLGATLVTFGGVSAAFTVDSDSQITATVPGPAPSSRLNNIAVTAPGGVVIGNLAFRVDPPFVAFAAGPQGKKSKPRRTPEERKMRAEADRLTRRRRRDNAALALLLLEP